MKIRKEIGSYTTLARPSLGAQASFSSGIRPNPIVPYFRGVPVFDEQEEGDSEGHDHGSSLQRWSRKRQYRVLMHAIEIEADQTVGCG